MSVRKAMHFFTASFFGLLITAQPLFVIGQWRFDRVQAQEADGEISPEDQLTESSPIDSLEELDPILLTSPALTIAPQDANAIREGRIDVRVTDYLIYLITPVEQGGAGFKHIKAQRILKNYDTDGTGRLDRETLDAIEEDGSIISAHHDGQAVDISEVGAITCKLVERRYFGGSTTKWQRPKAIKVAWQSRDGVSRNPTPKGPSLFEVANTMSAQSILMMLNESGEMDDFADYVKGLSVGEIFRYVGANILLKNYGAGDIQVDPLSYDVPEMLGAMLLQRSLPDLPTNLPIADGNQDIRVAVARAQIEDLLNLPAGSLRGFGWEKILESTGKRTMENALGLPTLTFDKKSLDDVLANDATEAALKQFARGDQSFGVIDGSIGLIQARDNRGFVWAGVKLLADALRLSDAQRQALTDAVKNSQQPALQFGQIGADQAVPIGVLASFFVANGSETQVLKDFGQRYLGQVLTKAVPNNLLGLTREVLSDMANSNSDVSYGDLRRTVGVRKIASDSSVSLEQADSLESGGNSRYHQEIAEALNSQLDLSVAAIEPGDVAAMLRGDNTELLSKVGGNQADKAIGWYNGTGYAVMNGDKTLEQGLSEVFSNSLSQLVGLPGGVEVSLDGDLYRNYGDALAENRLGFALAEGGSATDINPQTLYAGFGLRDSRSLSELRSDEGYWQRPDVIDALEFSDIRLGVPLGSSAAYLRGSSDNNSFSRQIAQGNLSTITRDRIINLLDLEDNYRLSGDEFTSIVTTLADWDGASVESQQRLLNLGLKLIGVTLDQRTTFEKGAILNIAQSQSSTELVDRLIDQGVRQLAGAFGVNVASFEEVDFRILARLLTNAYDGSLAGSQGEYGFTAEALLTKWLTDATGIPVESDVRTFMTGDIRTGLENWSAAQMVKFAGLYLPSGQELTYEELRNAINLTDSTLITARANEIAAANGGVVEDYIEQARRELMQEFRDEGKYKISDAFLRQAEIPIPINFSKVMFSGSSQERAEMLTVSLFAYLDSELRKVNPAYTPGTLEALYNGDISAGQLDQLVRNIVSGQSGPLGGFGTGFLTNFYSFISSPDKTTFFTDGRYQEMWGTMEKWFGNTLGVSGLPSGFAKSVYWASENNWNFDASVVENGQVVVPSINQIGSDLLATRITQWADTTMGLPAGSAYQLYKANAALQVAQRAGDATRIAAAQAELTVIAITVALNSCAACQQFFSSVDRALAAPPGFTNTLVAGAIASAFGLGPAGLIAAAAIYLFGVYKVDYLCPIPPPDRFAYPQFDSPQDALEPFDSAYYADPTTVVKDSPAPGENKFDWDDGVPFRDGNNPELWMAWSRYFTGKLLDATMSYGAAQQGAGKPLQIITYRQANVEFFAPRSADTFGPNETDNDRLGLGFTQNSTKTTDWVHAAFGGFF